MSSHRTGIIAEFKAKVALTAPTESKTLSEISSESGESFEPTCHVINSAVL